MEDQISKIENLWKRFRKSPLKTIVYAIVAMLFLAILSYLTSYFQEKARQAASNKNEFNEVVDENETIARIEFENKIPFIDAAVLGNDRIGKTWNVFLFKIQIHNTSNEETIRVKHLKLTELREWKDGEFKPWPDAESIFIDWDSSKPKDIPPRDRVLVPFARIYPPDLQQQIGIGDTVLTGSNDIPQLRFTVPPGKWPRRMISKVPPGKHRFKITVFFEQVPPVEAELELERLREQYDSVGQMASGIKVRML